MSSFSSLIENKNIVQLRPWTAVFKNELGIPAFPDQQHHQERENISGGATMYILNFQSTKKGLPLVDSWSRGLT